MAFSTEINFITDPSHADKGKIEISCTETTSGDNETRVYVEITGPDLLVFKEAAASPGDMEIVGAGTESILVDIPLDSNGDYMNGTYSFHIYTQLFDPSPPPGSLGPDVDRLEGDYVFCAHVTPTNDESNKVVYAATLSCVTGLLVATDSTDYTTEELTMTDRENRINPPPVDGRADVVGSGAAVSITITKINVNYETMLTVSYTYDPQTTGSTEFLTLGGSINPITVPADCQNTVCNALSCVQSQFDALITRYCTWSAVPQGEKDNFNYISTLMNLAVLQMGCGNVTKANELLQQVIALTNCSCGCNDAASSPADFVPPT